MSCVPLYSTPYSAFVVGVVVVVVGSLVFSLLFSVSSVLSMRFFRKAVVDDHGRQASALDVRLAVGDSYQERRARSSSTGVPQDKLFEV